jgi:putative ABC transport system permease protein
MNDRTDVFTEAVQDLRFALRRVRRAPALAVAVVSTLGLGLGAATAVFTASRAALLDRQPFARSERLVHLWERSTRSTERSPTSYASLLDWRERSTTMAALEGYNGENFTVVAGDDARMLRGAQITAGFFRLLGVVPASGRDFAADDDGVAIVSDRLARALGGARAVGTSIVVNGNTRVVVGVLPRTFHFALLQDADVWVTPTIAAADRADRSVRWVHVVGRLRDDVRLDAMRAQLSSIMSDLGREYPDDLAGRTVDALLLRDALLGDVKPILLSLVGAVGILLVAIAANLALLTLSRFIERAPELATRAALGATRARVIRQLLAESVASSVVGGALALLVGNVATRQLLATIPEGVRIGMPYLADASIDPIVASVVVAFALLLSLAFGLGPALLATSGPRRQTDTRTTFSRAERRVRKGLVVAQVALTVVLLVASGLLATSFRQLVTRNVGFTAPEELVTARVSLSGARYEAPEAQRQFFESLLERTAALPGVRSVAVISSAPGGGGGMTAFESLDRPVGRAARPRAALRMIGGEYFTAMGVRLLAGRALASSDDANAPRAVVVSASLAQLLATDAEVIGRRLRFEETENTVWEVVGVVGDVHITALDAESPPVAYVSHLQLAENRMSIVARARVPLAEPLRAIVRSMDAQLAVYAVGTLEQQMRDSRAVFQRRFPLTLVGVFAATALLLALIALHAICAHDVFTRRREFGIRVALGGSPAMIRRSILQSGVVLAGVGLAIGIAVALVAARAMSVVLFGVAPGEWRVYASVAAVVIVSALLATLRPAIRAGSVHPSVMLRAE